MQQTTNLTERKLVLGFNVLCQPQRITSARTEREREILHLYWHVIKSLTDVSPLLWVFFSPKNGNGAERSWKSKINKARTNLLFSLSAPRVFFIIIISREELSAEVTKKKKKQPRQGWEKINRCITAKGAAVWTLAMPSVWYSEQVNSSGVDF